MQPLRISIKTTTVCDGGCSFCGVSPWMKSNPGYHMSIEDIDNFIKYSEDAGYIWDDVVWTGGEPFLWKHWEEAAEKMMASKSINKIFVYTNGKWITDREEVARRANLFSTIIVSAYEFNIEQIKIAHGLVSVKLRDEFFELPEKSYPNTVPALCGCRAYGLYDGKVSLCTAQPYLSTSFGFDFSDTDWETELKPNFLDYIDNTNVVKRDICSYCFGNRRVEKQLNKIKNKVRK